MSNDIVVVGPDQMPDWVEKRNNIMAEVDKQLVRGLREPGQGLTLDHLQGTVEHRNMFPPVIQVIFQSTLPKPFDILGRSKVVLAEETLYWGREVPKEVPLFFSEDALKKCAEENEQGMADWRLFYAHGLSLRQQREIMGTNIKKQPCFDKSFDWWLQPQQDSWATQATLAGYHLIDFKGRWPSTSWDQQDENVSFLGDQYERAHEAVVTEGAFNFFLIHKERLLPNWYHWGRNLSSDGARVYVGFFGQRGWYVYGARPGYVGHDYLRVCLSVKFQK